MCCDVRVGSRLRRSPLRYTGFMTQYRVPPETPVNILTFSEFLPMSVNVGLLLFEVYNLLFVISTLKNLGSKNNASAGLPPLKHSWFLLSTRARFLCSLRFFVFPHIHSTSCLRFSSCLTRLCASTSICVLLFV
uniref:ORF14 n=1 Tax=Malaco herpesvirus 4 TaxID=3031800 RepID=A0AA48SF17_9VIRU|nr:TPA_asm: ORF14 [Malaco herpesvirus 4]